MLVGADLLNFGMQMAVDIGVVLTAIDNVLLSAADSASHPVPAACTRTGVLEAFTRGSRCTMKILRRDRVGGSIERFGGPDYIKGGMFCSSGQDIEFSRLDPTQSRFPPCCSVATLPGFYHQHFSLMRMETPPRRRRPRRPRGPEGSGRRRRLKRQQGEQRRKRRERGIRCS